jgi:hypothetical protein
VAVDLKFVFQPGKSFREEDAGTWVIVRIGLCPSSGRAFIVLRYVDDVIAPRRWRSVMFLKPES